MKIHITFSIAILAMLAIASNNAIGQELTSNGGFETGDTSDWVSFPTATSTFETTSDSNSGGFAGVIFNDSAPSAAVVKQANLGIGTVMTGDEINISFAAKGSFANGGVSFAEFFSEIDGGGVSKSEILSGAPLALTDEWQIFEFTTTAGSDVSGGVTLQLTATTGAAAGSTAEVFIDDVSVSIAVPEPATASVLGLFALGLASFRRRQA